MKRVPSIAVLLAAVLFITACGGGISLDVPIGTANYATQETRQHPNVIAATVEIEGRTVTLITAVTADTTVGEAQEIGHQFALAFGRGAALAGGDAYESPSQGDYGSIFRDYDLEVIVESDDGEPIAHGTKRRDASFITWSER